MTKMELKNLIMESYVLSTEKKIQLINAINKGLIDNTQLEEITNFLLKNKKAIDNATSKYVENMKKEYNKYLRMKIPEIKKNINIIKIKAEEIVFEESMGNPDNILNKI